MDVKIEGNIIGVTRKRSTSNITKRFRIEGITREDVGNVVLVVAEFGVEEGGEEHVPAINLDKQQSYVIG